MDVAEKTILPLHFTMSRDPDVQHQAHLEAAEKVCEYLEVGQDVAMPNLGDVSIYSTYCYLMELVKETVCRQTGVVLEPEVKFLGF